MNGGRYAGRATSYFAAAALFAICLQTSVVAQNTPSWPDLPCNVLGTEDRLLSLSRAVDIALCSNAQLRSAAASVRIKAAELGQTRAELWPSLTGVITELKESTAYAQSGLPGSSDTATTLYGDLTWRLFDFGIRQNDVRAAAHLLQAALSFRDATVQTVLGNVVQSYYDAVTAKAILENRKRDQEVSKDVLASAQRRLDQGDGTRSDVLQARTSLAHIGLELNRARGAYDKSLAVLAYAVGLPLSARFEVANEAQAPVNQYEKSLDAWLREAEEKHPAIAAARDQVEAARAHLAGARAGGKPTVDFQANYYANGFPQQGLAADHQRSTTVGIAVSMPLFDGFLRRYRVQAAEADVQAKDAVLVDIERATEAEIVKAYADAEAAVGDLRESQSLMEAAEAAEESSKRRYEAGAADILELLTTESALANARHEQVRSNADWLSARLRLLAVSGVLTRDAF